MANVNANINVNINTQQASAQLRKLSADISRFNQQSFAANSAAAQQQRALNQALIDGVRTSGQFRTSIVPITSAVDRFATSIEKGRLSLGQYTRYAASQLPGMRRIFTREFDMINRVAVSRVKTLNTQFVALGDSVGGAQKALAMTPVALDQYSSKAAIALQRTQIFNRLLRDGSTQLLNWGKNTQWAGRQLMVGFTIPLGILGAQAAKVFKELEAEAVNFRKVYGDMFTTDVEVEKNLQAVKELATEMTKYGISIQQSMELANVAAQSGARGADLISQTTEATRLAVLGQMEQQEAIKTTITLQNAFQLSNEELTESINFLNVVENQSVLSLQNVTEAIPRVAPVIKSLGGDVKDLSVMLVAMREGGVSAAEGANALKTSLARLVSPTSGAVKMAEKFGINLQNIVVENKGDILGAVMELADAMKVLDDLSQQQLMSEIFGKRQYARIGALFNNITNDASQAQRVLELTTMSTRDLAATAERELSAVEDSVGAKFTGAMERAKLALAPVGEEFLKALTPVLDFVGKILSKFDEMPNGLKTAIVAATGIIGGLAPIVLMVTGLVANGIANIAKFILFLRKQVATLRGNGEAFKMYTSAELEAAAAAASLEGKTSTLTATMNLQKPAIETLITLYQRLAASARAAAAAMPATMGAGPVIGMGRLSSLPKGGLPTLPQARNAGGPIFMSNGRTVPGSGNTDKVPAMLTPGEYVVNKEATQSNRGLLEAINSGDVVSRNKGGMIPGVQYLRLGGGITQYLSQTAGRSGIQNKYQARSIENKLGDWLGGNMKTVNFRELVKTGIARNTGKTELFRGIRMASSDTRYLGFPPEVQNALFMYGKTRDKSFLDPILGRAIAIEPRSFSQSRKVAKEFSGANEDVVSPVIFKLTNEKGIMGVNPYAKVGATRQSKDQAREARSFRFSEKEIIPVGNPAIGQRPDAIVARIGVDKKGDIILDSGAKFSKKEIARASNELAKNKKANFTPKDILKKELVEVEKLENQFKKIIRKGIPQGDKRFLDEMSSMFTTLGLSKTYNPGTYSDKKLVQKIDQRKRALSDKISQAFNAAGGVAKFNTGGQVDMPRGLSLFSPDVMKVWATNKARKMQASQSKMFMANRGNIVPGMGNTDTVPAMLTPGEFVVNKKATQQNLPLIQAINDGKPVSYLNEGTQSGSRKYSTSDPAIRAQTARFRSSGLFGPEVSMLQRMFGSRLSQSQLSGLTQYDASHMAKAVRDASGKKIFNPFQLRPELAAMNNYYPRMESSLKNMLDTSMKTEKSFKLFGKETTLSAKIAEKTGLTQKQVYKELTKLRDGVPPATDNARNVARRFAQIDAITTRTALQAQQASGRKSGPKTALGLPSTSRKDGVYRPQAYRSEAFLATQRSLTNRGFFASPQNITYAQAMGMQPLPRVAPSAPRAPITYSQATSTQAMARKIMREAPGTNARQALQIARLQQMGGGGGGGRTPTFLGMPGMPDQPPRQSMYARANAAVGKFGMGAGMGLSMAGMLPMMRQDEQGKFMGMDAGTAMMGMMGGGMLLSIAPMLQGAALPVIAVGAAAAALAIGLKIWRNNVDQAAKKTADLGANMGGTANALNTMATLFGEQTPAQRRTQMQLGFTAEEQEQSFGEFQNYLGSEQGQAFIKDLENATSAERFTKLSSYLANAIAAGILDEQKAKLFAKTVATSLNDAVLGSSVIKAIAGQKVGAQGLLELAEKRFDAVEASGAMQRLESEETIASTDAASIVGSSIQVIQDFSNVAALAKEEYIAGNTTFAEYRETVNRAREAQERYTSAMEGAFTKTNDFGATMQGWRDQLILSGVDEETIGAFQRAATKRVSAGPAGAAGTPNFFRQLTGGQLTTGRFFSSLFLGTYEETNEEILTAMTAASKSGKYNDTDIAAIAENIIAEPQGRIAQVFEEYGRGERGIGRALFEQKMQESDIPGLEGGDEQRYIDLAFQFDERSGDLVDFETFINNVPEAIRTKLLIDFEGLSSESRARMVADQAAFAQMFGMDLANRLMMRSPQYRESLGITETGQGSATQSPRYGVPRAQGSRVSPYVYDFRDVGPSGSPVTDFLLAGQTGPAGEERRSIGGANQGPAATIIQETEAKETEDAINEELDRLYENLGAEAGKSLQFALKLELETEPEPRQLTDILSDISGAVEYIDRTIPKEIQIALGIDTADPQQMMELDQYRGQLLGLSQVFKVMSAEQQEVAARIAISIVDGENKPLTADQLVEQTNKVLKAYDKLESKNPEVRRNALVTIVQSYENQDGERLTPEDAQEYINRWEEVEGFDISVLSRAQISQLVDLETRVDGAEEQLRVLKQLRALAGIRDQGEEVARLNKEIEALEGILGSTSAERETIISGGATAPSGPGGGGAQKSPLEGFVQNILNQFKMWTDASAKMKDLNNARKNFVDNVLKGDSIFKQLNKAVGFDPARLQEILGMGPEGAKEFLDKYVKDGTLTKAGKNILDAATQAGIGQTIGGNVIAARQARQQTVAANFLSGRGEGSQVIQSIAGDPQKAAELLRLRKEYNKAVEGGNAEDIEKAEKVLNRYINSERRLVRVAKEREEALKSASEKAIEANNDIIEANNDYMQEGDRHFEREQRNIERNYRDRIKSAEDQIESLNDQIDSVNKLIEAEEKLNRADQNRIRDLQRQQEMLSRQLEELERANELDQRRIDTLSREDEIRNRAAEALDRELELMSRAEDDIRESYQKRIEALDEVAKVNDYIINQQKQQLDLSRAISEGDIYAATAAAQEMRASSAGFAVEQVRSGLEQGMENQIEGLRTSGGLTREQAEERIRGIEDQSYQTSLQIRDIEDQIYNRNLQMIPIKDQIRNYDMQIRDIQDQIYDRETIILGIQNQRLEPLQTALRDQEDILDKLNKQVEAEIEAIEFDGMKADQWADAKFLLNDQNESLIEQNELLAEEDKRLAGLSRKWNKIATQIAEANRFAKERISDVNATAAAKVANIDAKTELSSTERAEQIQQATRDRLQELRRIEAERKAKTEALLDSGANLGAYAGGLMKYAMGGMANPRRFTSNEAPPVQKRARGGGVFGNGSRDSIPAMLTPGEFVIRKAMVDKYGVPMMKALNQGSFAMPRYNMGEEMEANIMGVTNNNVSNINAPVYNTYDMKFAINGTNQSADEIANQVMFKMRQIQSQGIRGNRGY